MKALFLDEHGGFDVLRYGDRPDPVAGPGEILVRVRAAALNRLDLFVLAGIPGVPIALPHVPGADGCRRRRGARRGRHGSRARHARRDPARALVRRVRVLPRRASRACASRSASSASTFPARSPSSSRCPRANVYPAPAGLTDEQAAAFPLAALTAWRLLVTRAALRPGETVLIHGIGGGVSTFALQIAKLCGASRVIVTSSSEEKRARAKEMGADDVLDSKDDVGKRVRELTKKRGVDVVLDSVGAATWRHSLVAAAKGGRIVTPGATSGPNPEEEIRHIFWKQLSILGSTMGTDAEFAALLAAVSAGRIVPVVDSVVPLAEGRKAYERMQSSQGLGKIVLEVPV